MLSDVKALRGVNLGNWLLLEKWMRPRLFEGAKACDEYTLCEALGAQAERHLRQHRDTYITGDDFAWLAARGINAVRIPFGYWIVDPDAPFVTGAEYLDRAVMLAEEHGLQVLLDLHGLPGSQGPNDHTGRSRHFRWHEDPGNMSRSLDVIEQVAQRYAGRPHIIGFGVVNEPEPEVGRPFLVDFYERAYERVRRHMPAEDVAFVLAAFPENQMDNYHGCLPGRHNVWTDVHLYQNFGDWSQWKLLDYLAYPLTRQARLRPYVERGPVIVGEWSMGFAPNIVEEISRLPGHRQQLIRRMHGNMLLSMLEEFTGWFFWSYKVDDRPEWSFRDAVDCGWLPDYVGDRILRGSAHCRAALAANG